MEEDLQDREEELKAELTMATRRCNDLKQTLHQTKSFIESTFGQPAFASSNRMQLKAAGAKPKPVPSTCVSVLCVSFS